jgi:hypothetical protein
MKLLPMNRTNADSTAAAAPPHAVHTADAFGQVAELFSNEDSVTVREPKRAPMAPPAWATLFKNVQLETDIVLE